MKLWERIAYIALLIAGVAFLGDDTTEWWGGPLGGALLGAWAGWTLDLIKDASRR
jgi:hypothetical protein